MLIEPEHRGPSWSRRVLSATGYQASPAPHFPGYRSVAQRGDAHKHAGQCGTRVGDLTVDLVQERHEVGAGGLGTDVGDHCAGGDLQRREWVAGSVALVVVRGACGGGGSNGRIGAVRFNAWIWGFSSTANTAAVTGGFK